MLTHVAWEYGPWGGKVFPFNNIIEKFFKDHHDKEGLDNLKEWQSIAKCEHFNKENLRYFLRTFLQRRKEILDAHFEWTPENKECFVEFNRQIHMAEQDIFKHLIVMRRTLKELYENGQEYLSYWETKSRIDFTGYIEDHDFENLLNFAIPETHLSEFVRNSYTCSKVKLKRPTKDWAYEFNDSQKECASIEAFKKLPLHKHAGFLMFDSGTYALQDFVNMYIRFEASTDIHYFDREA